MLGFKISPEQRALQQLARRFAREEILPAAARCDRTEEFPLESKCAAHAWTLGLMNLCVPKEFGGTGLGVLDTVVILEEPSYGRSASKPSNGASRKLGQAWSACRNARSMRPRARHSSATRPR